LPALLTPIRRTFRSFAFFLYQLFALELLYQFDIKTLRFEPLQVNVTINDMADQPVNTSDVTSAELDDDNPNYQPPQEKSLKDIIAADQEDESLRKYKEALLGSAVSKDAVVFEKDPRKVIVMSLALLVDGHPDLVLDLSGNVDQLKKKPFIIKEGIQYKIRIDFHVQREIVTGLKYVQKIHRHGLQVEKMSQMIGSYPPKQELHSFTTPAEEMPSGMLARGTYTVKSLFTDDDKSEHLKWEWSFELKKDWE